MVDKNPYTGSTFDDFLDDNGLLEECTALALKRVLARQIKQEMDKQGFSKTAMAERMHTSRSQLNRLLDPENTGISLEMMHRAASIVGRRLEIYRLGIFAVKYIFSFILQPWRQHPGYHRIKRQLA